MVVAAKAPRAVPDGVMAVEMAADEHAQSRTGAAAGLLRELQGEELRGHDDVASDDALMFDAENLLEIHAPQPDEGRGAIGRGPTEFGIEGGNELLAQVAVRRGERRN